MTPTKIYQRIPEIMSAIGAIGRNGKNEDDNYEFRKIEDVLNKLQPLLAKHKVFYVPEVLEASEDKVGRDQIRVVLRVKYRLFSDDGSSFEAIVQGEAIDDSDKASNKAQTAAQKQMLVQVFCIKFAELEDADKNSPKLNFTSEKKAADKAPQSRKRAPVAAALELCKPIKDMKIPEGKFKGKMLSSIPKAHVEQYVNDMLNGMNSSGVTPQKWFLELKQAAGL